MKYSKLFIGLIMMAAATTASAAIDLTRTVTVNFSSEDGFFTGSFGNGFDSADKGKSFLDVYTFNLSGLSDFDAAVTSIATISKTGPKLDLNISSFELFAGNTAIAYGEVNSSGKIDLQSITATSLSSGAYSLQVGGTVIGTMGGSYGGNVNVSPVPEPETWSMFVAGMAAVGFVSRRRKLKSKTPHTVAA